MTGDPRTPLTAAPTLTGLGLTAAPTGTATVATDMSGIPTFTFDHRWTSTLPAMLYSNTKAPASWSTAGGSSLGIGNFVIDTAALLVTGDVTANGTDGLGRPFHHRPEHIPRTADAAGAFTSIFGAPNLTGANVGFATVNAQARPYLSRGPG